MEKITPFVKEKIHNFPFWFLTGTAIIFFLAGYFYLNMFSGVVINSQSILSNNQSPTRLVQTKFPLINPLLLCNLDRITDSVDLSLKQKITRLTNERILQGKATDISVYLQEYGVGKWVGVNENTQYDPASLLKVPLMIAYYQIAEKNPSLLSQVISFNGDDQNTDEYFKSLFNIKAGKNYTVEQLIESMIVNSDNTSMTLLSHNVDKNQLFTVYTDLGLPTPPEDPTVEYLSTKSYAYFFRILYNSTYLNKIDSQKALDLLSQGHLPNGIKSALPDTIIVADKFGERSVYDQNHNLMNRELHDCGIVYATKSPYLLCIMSKGTNFNDLSQNIHDISALVYSNLSK